MTSRTAPRSFGLGLFLLAWTGCTTWSPSPAGIEDLLRDGSPSSVRLTTHDGLVVTARDPAIAGDSVTSTREGCNPVTLASGREMCFEGTETVAVAAIEDVQSVEVQRVSAARVLGVTVLTLGVLYSFALFQTFN